MKFIDKFKQSSGAFSIRIAFRYAWWDWNGVQLWTLSLLFWDINLKRTFKITDYYDKDGKICKGEIKYWQFSIDCI